MCLVFGHREHFDFTTRILETQRGGSVRSGAGAVESRGDGPGKASPDKLLRYALSLPVHVAVNGIYDHKQLKHKMEVCYNFQPLPDPERRALQVALHDSDVMLAYNKPDYARA
ncbi:MAG: hypothetical protein NTY01_17235 [Verrucomicrobia bacterium]|nr:hypothetical protein [Verrucomicrobiota bacterium]